MKKDYNLIKTYQNYLFKEYNINKDFLENFSLIINEINIKYKIGLNIPIFYYEKNLTLNENLDNFSYLYYNISPIQNTCLKIRIIPYILNYLKFEIDFEKDF